MTISCFRRTSQDKIFVENTEDLLKVLKSPYIQDILDNRRKLIVIVGKGKLSVFDMANEDVLKILYLIRRNTVEVKVEKSIDLKEYMTAIYFDRIDQITINPIIR